MLNKKINLVSVGFKCSLSQKEELISRSQGNLSEYLRGIIFEKTFSKNSSLLSTLERIEESISTLAASQEGGKGEDGGEQNLFPLLAEMLLFMRKATSPERADDVARDMRRYGIKRKEFV
ncbi:hypothetical protein [Entomobacter blattae]|uniref:Uncharacterized protein n=1 Tax=Entomobacter blattae TaxID=2762277 RepID=A0A7H1NP67_9PROT|nr:hypothetical protein [Entomobacter blattae]QNT77577.1 hypothetical protein JGUZn3_03200 [Entomobacter blattae]QNT78433.1 hypothetical protein JGUZn3_12070 [Entomobacter blattae]